MIKKYNEYIKESVLDKLKGLSEEEALNNFKDTKMTANELFEFSCKKNFIQGVKLAIEKGVTDYDIFVILINPMEKGEDDLVRYLLENFDFTYADLKSAYEGAWVDNDISLLLKSYMDKKKDELK